MPRGSTGDVQNNCPVCQVGLTYSLPASFFFGRVQCRRNLFTVIHSTRIYREHYEQWLITSVGAPGDASNDVIDD